MYLIVNENVYLASFSLPSYENVGKKVAAGPIANVSRCQLSEIFRTAAGPTLLYLSPEQRELFDNVPIAIVNGHAGEYSNTTFFTENFTFS